MDHTHTQDTHAQAYTYAHKHKHLATDMDRHTRWGGERRGKKVSVETRAQERSQWERTTQPNTPQEHKTAKTGGAAGRTTHAEKNQHTNTQVTQQGGEHEEHAAALTLVLG